MRYPTEKFRFVTGLVLLCWGTLGNAVPLRGSYSVPVAPDLAPYATFDVVGKMISARETARVFSYNLPEDLVGAKKTEIILQEAGEAQGLAVFQGKIANAACINGNDGTGKLLMCFVMYHSLGVDPVKTTQFLQGKYTGAEGLNARIDVAVGFIETPGGVIRFPSVP